MAKKKILITVKTYPTLSKTYNELVCTTGFDEEGNFIRLYPIPFRELDYGSQYPKYSWIELEIKKNTSDFRPESYRPINVDDIQIAGKIETDGEHWQERRKLVLKKIYKNLTALISEAKDNNIGTSLAVFKPKNIIDFIYRETEREWDKEKLEYIKANAMQQDLFRSTKNIVEVVKKLPYKFSYTIEDEDGRQSKMMIEDWETGQLYWNCQKSKGDEQQACELVREKYIDDFAKTKDLYLFLGTTKKFHNIAPNPFVIIGTFHPKPIIQPYLDF